MTKPGEKTRKRPKPDTAIPKENLKKVRSFPIVGVGASYKKFPFRFRAGATTEDDARICKEDIQKLTDKYEAAIEELLTAKTQEIEEA